MLRRAVRHRLSSIGSSEEIPGGLFFIPQTRLPLANFIAPITELDAVNEILASIGEAPIATLDDNFVDGESARAKLHQVSRQVQASGWSFNTENDWVLTPDVNGYINLPIDFHSVVINDDPDHRVYVKRGNRLYNRLEQTYEFTDPVTATKVVRILPFDELPELLRQFIVVRAGRRFQATLEGDRLINQFLERDELAAWAAFMNDEAKNARWNVVRDSSTVLRIKGVNRYA